jgi:hypothetical protein
VFEHYLFKPSIWLEEDIPVHSPGVSAGDWSSISTPGTPLGENGLAPISETNQGALARPIAPSLGLEGEVAIIAEPPSPKED